ncbi:hypothetical protein QDR98_15330 [Acinetobacter baumannii]|uniref:hypothetical protein n=1 Tax=Acinetobacter baumannii TaxID=470 RepID=UPI00244B546B|nr:hypothetical protein [Acinetobacter baumannii]MDH2667300.1 hypothetical protein [Acinetobacter baumannii]
MAVQEQTPYVEYVANGITTSFALGFDCDNRDHLIVLVDDVEPVAGAWSFSNGAVVFNAAPENGKKITIQRNTPFSRSTDYQSYNNSFRPPAVNNDFDRVWYKIQELGVKDWLLDLKIQKFRDDVNLTALENTLEEAKQIRDDTADSVVEVQSNVAQSQTLLGNTTAQANLAQGYASSANSANAAAQQAAIDVSTAKADVYSALSAQQIAVNNSLTAIAGGHKAYQTLAAAQAAQATLPVNSIVEVTNDGANNGTYQWNGTTLTKSAYDPLTQAKNYTDSFFTYYDAASLLTVKNYFVLSSNGVAASSASFDCSDFIPVVESETYNIYSQITGIASHAWYDKDKVFISSFGTDQTTLAVKSYVAPTNARYVRISAYNTTARASAYLSSKSHVINKVKEIIRQHTPNLDASKVIYGSSDVNATLNTIISKQSAIIANQNNIVGQLDLMTDKESPYFVNTTHFVKAVLTPTNFGVVDVTSRVSDTQMEVSDASAFVYSGSCVVYDPTANSYTSHNVIGINGTTITVMPPLPANPTQVQTMHDSNQGQHLTLFGYKGLADHIVNCVQKYSYKKAENLLFNFNPSKFVRQTNSQGQITTDGTTVAIPVTLLGTAKTGGYVAGTTNLIKTCDMNSGNLNIGNNAHTQYLSRSYQLVDGIAGNGFEISFDGQGNNGFIEIPLAVRDESYTSSADSQTYRTSGKARLQVFNGSTSIHDAVYAAGQVHHVFIDFTAAETIKVRVTCETSTPTSVLLSGIFAYKKSANTSKESFFKDGDVIAFLGDSWTQYPLATAIGEPAAAYPISKMSQTFKDMYPYGRASSGTQWLSKRIKQKLASSGVNVEVLNVGLGGQTSRWGKYWIDAILTMNPKPTHCVLCFYINDNNSIANPSNNAYDIDPALMFANKAETAGGVNGKIASYSEWETNMKWLCDKLTANGIKPIVIMPSQTASSTQAQAIRAGQLDRIASGFSI